MALFTVVSDDKHNLHIPLNTATQVSWSCGDDVYMQEVPDTNRTAHQGRCSLSFHSLSDVFCCERDHIGTPNIRSCRAAAICLLCPATGVCSGQQKTAQRHSLAGPHDCIY